MEQLPIVELFYSLQGEGKYTGCAVVFIRLAGCRNACTWCDAKNTWKTDLFPPILVANIIETAKTFSTRTAIITGGEPLLYSLDYLCEQLKKEGFRIHIETSGTENFSGSLDWVCLSPKPQRQPLSEAYQKANELKVIIEQTQDFAWAEENAKKVSSNCLLFLQPEWSRWQEITPQITEYIKQHPQWRLSLQTHKFLNIP